MVAAGSSLAQTASQRALRLVKNRLASWLWPKELPFPFGPARVRVGSRGRCFECSDVFRRQSVSGRADDYLLFVPIVRVKAVIDGRRKVRRDSHPVTLKENDNLSLLVSVSEPLDSVQLSLIGGCQLVNDAPNRVLWTRGFLDSALSRSVSGSFVPAQCKLIKPGDAARCGRWGSRPHLGENHI